MTSHPLNRWHGAIVDQASLLFGLPLSVRLEIYALSRIVRRCPIDFIKEAERRKVLVRAFPNSSGLRRFQPYLDCLYNPHTHGRFFRRRLGCPECFCAPVPLQLLLSCRLIHDEVVPLLYGRNVFMLSIDAYRTTLFKQPSSTSLSFLRYLQITIPRQGMSEVSGALKLFSEECTLTKLDLSLSYDNFGPIGFGRLSECLERFSGLKSCAISLGTPGEPRRTSLAKMLVLKATKTLDSTQLQPFRFMDLPEEMRYEVLLHTNLVVRWREGCETVGISVVNGRQAIGGKRVSGLAMCCRKCTPSCAMCCCSQRHAAFSLTCACYRFPGELFQVSWQFYEEAQKVFCGENRFSFYGHPLDTVEFLRKLSPGSFKLIRTIDLQIGLEEVFLWPPESQGGHPHWKNLLFYLSQHLDLSRVIISLDATYNPQTWRLDGCDMPEFLAFYQDITESFRQLPAFRKLRGFQMFLPCFNEYEAVAEKAIKGDQYDSALQGKIAFENRALDHPHGVPYKRIAWMDWRLRGD